MEHVKAIECNACLSNVSTWTKYLMGFLSDNTEENLNQSVLQGLMVLN